MTKASNEDSLLGHLFHHQYVSDFDDFGTNQKRLQRASQWYQNHQNPMHIEDEESWKFLQIY